jgi:hypothetical protein
LHNADIVLAEEQLGDWVFGMDAFDSLLLKI